MDHLIDRLTGDPTDEGVICGGNFPVGVPGRVVLRFLGGG